MVILDSIKIGIHHIQSSKADDLNENLKPLFSEWWKKKPTFFSLLIFTACAKS